MVLTPITVFAMWLALGPLRQGDDARADHPRNKMEGTWEHTIASNPGLAQVKVINQDHFIWVTYDRALKLAVTTAGGSYTLDGDTYKEKVEFGRFGSRDSRKPWAMSRLSTSTWTVIR